MLSNFWLKEKKKIIISLIVLWKDLKSFKNIYNKKIDYRVKYQNVSII